MASEEPNEPHFETALSQLEEIVAALEHGEPDLAAALAKYETGVRLLSQCYALLERAERSVALLSGIDSEGNAATTPFDATATLETERQKRKEPRGDETEPVRRSKK
jgi:exodeoxyribonuclease VII small subunit